MDSFPFSCIITPSSPHIPLGLEIWIDHSCIFNSEHISDTVTVLNQVANDKNNHQLVWKIKNKLPQHTHLDHHGNIIKDAVLNIGCIQFDHVDCTQTVINRAVYNHGNQTTKFFGDCGCNGSVCFDFYTPIYHWLLDTV